MPPALLADAERPHLRSHQCARRLACRRLVGVVVAVALVLALRHDEAAGNVGAGPVAGVLEAERRARAVAVLLRHGRDP